MAAVKFYCYPHLRQCRNWREIEQFSVVEYLGRWFTLDYQILHFPVDVFFI